MNHEEASDNTLVVQCALQDPVALAELHTRYSTRVFSAAILVTQNSALAEEAAQDAFMRLWMRASQYQEAAGASRFIGWLLTIARRCAIDVLRREFSRSGCMVPLEDVSTLPDTTCEADARWRDLAQMMDGLSAGQREVIMLGFYRGMSQSEIAEVLQLPLGTVKGRARAALRELRWHLHSSDMCSSQRALLAAA